MNGRDPGRRIHDAVGVEEGRNDLPLVRTIHGLLAHAQLRLGDRGSTQSGRLPTSRILTTPPLEGCVGDVGRSVVLFDDDVGNGTH